MRRPRTPAEVGLDRTTRLTRRQLLGGLSVGVASAGLGARPAATAGARREEVGPLAAGVLPSTIRARHVDGINGLRMHVLEAGHRAPSRPGVLLLHGFPELAYSWRKVMPALAEAGYHVLAPDLRGYGRTDGTAVTYDDDLRPFRMVNEIRDMLALVSAFGYHRVHLVGHDFGALVASWCAVARPDVFRSVVLMSAPFGGTATLPFDTVDASLVETRPVIDIDAALARLTPPRRHYRRYYATRTANEEMWRAPQGVHDFLRGYYHMKSADWSGNRPSPLAAWSAAELAKLPRYYVMDLDKTMAETVAEEMPSAADIASNVWLSDDELRVYSHEYARTGFQGGLQWYRSNTAVTSIFGAEGVNADLQVFAGRTIDQPSLFVAGASDWGIHQRPGALETMQSHGCSDLRGLHLLDGAGHWVQQEQPDAATALILRFFREV